ncbi:MAG: hypothetical protein ACI9CO_002477 [Candidatus Azotimanducaceae bacterium]|jgi:hypothetical protein
MEAAVGFTREGFHSDNVDIAGGDLDRFIDGAAYIIPTSAGSGVLLNEFSVVARKAPWLKRIFKKIKNALRRGPDVRTSEYMRSNASRFEADAWTLDCSDIAEEFFDQMDGEWSILNIEVSGGSVNWLEYGVETGFEYHQVYQNGNFIYDPRYNPDPVRAKDYWKAMENLNEGVELIIKDVTN